MSDKTQLIDIEGLKVFKEQYDILVDDKISKIVNTTYTLSKNADGEIILIGSDDSVTKVVDANTTYTFVENNHILTITGSDGTSESFTIGGGSEITKQAIIDALGFTPMESYTEIDPTVPAHVKSITSENISSWNNKSEFSGSYNDLEDKPDIPNVPDWALETSKPTYTAAEVGALPNDTHIPNDVTEATVSGWGFTKNSGTYSKPSDGIPKTDLDSVVQTSLEKADTAIQSLEGYATEDFVTEKISELPSPMVFKGSLGTDGTITILPSAEKANEGFTYKVITDGTYASQDAKIGDIFISNGSSWILVPSGDDPSGSGTVTSVGVSVPTGLSVSGSPITTSGTISITMATGYSIPTTSKQSAWDGKQSALSADQLAATNSGITKAIVDAIPSSYAPTNAQANVIETIKVNGTAQTVTSKAVNITVPTKASDIGAMESTVTHLSGDVPTSRTVNGKALSSNITLSASDVGALPDTTEIPEILYGTSEPTSSQGKNGDIYIKLIG